MAKDTLMKTAGFLILGTLLLLPEIASSQTSLFRDMKANKVGDVITVILQESTSGSSTSDSKLSTNTGGAAGGSVTGNFLPFQPTFGSDAQVNFDTDQKNLSNQRQLLEGFISVQIQEVTPGGDLVIAGNRLTEVNGEIHEMNLTGIVRSNDVNSANQVLSYRIANANISYLKKGGISKKSRDRGLLKKVAFGAVSLGLGAAIILRQLNN